MRLGVGNRDLARLRDVFRPTRPFNLVLAGRKVHRFAGASVNLRMEEEVGSQSSRRRGINPPLRVSEQKRSHRGTAIDIKDVESDGHRGLGGEQDVEIAAEPQILRPLADIEPKLRLASARVSAVNRDQAVFDLQAGESFIERAIVEARHVHPALRDIRREDARLGLRAVGRLPINRRGVWTLDGQRRGHAGFVLHFHKEHGPTILVQARRRRSLNRLHPALGVDVDPDETERVERFLDCLDGFFWIVEEISGLQPLQESRGERLAEKAHRLAQPLRLSGQRLEIDIGDDRQAIGPRHGSSQTGNKRNRGQDAS